MADPGASALLDSVLTPCFNRDAMCRGRTMMRLFNRQSLVSGHGGVAGAWRGVHHHHWIT
jgi:hypothetical protein